MTPDRIRINLITPQPWPATPHNQQALASLECIPLTTGTHISFTPQPTDTTLVLASAFDKREPCRLRLQSGDWSYLLDVGYCSIAQRFHVTIPAGVCDIAVAALDDDVTFWALDDSSHLPDSVPSVWINRTDVNRLDRFYQRLEKDCVAEFGWMGGCVLEAYDALALCGDAARWNAARDRWLGYFLDDQHLTYQDRFGKQCVDTYSIIEATLPVASITRCRPSHPIINITADYLRKSESTDATCEGCYTVAYTLMQIATVSGQSDLVDLAMRELSHRREKLFVDGNIYLRYHGTHHTYRNWTRGIAWYLLGNIKCLQLAGSDPRWADTAKHIAERVAWAMQYQREDGLWDNFFDEPGPPPDTAGSAGIAAALIYANELGLAGDDAVAAAERCWDRLPDHLFVDGWLGCVAPSNKRGETAQHGSSRASETFGMGLMGILAGAIDRHTTNA